MGGGGGHAPHEVPDWRTFKAEGIPELDRLQKRLAARGLRDPWIRLVMISECGLLFGPTRVPMIEMQLQ